MLNSTEQLQEMVLSDHGDSYLCRHCNHEGLKPTFGMSIECPACGSTDIVCAEFWRCFKKINASADSVEAKALSLPHLKDNETLSLSSWSIK